MGAFREYVEQLDKKIEAFKKSKENVSEIEIIRLIYIDLGQNLNFDLHYIFGNKSKKKAIYGFAEDEEALDRAFEKKETICKSIAMMLNIILKRYGFSSTVEFECDEFGIRMQLAHVYNKLLLSDGRECVLDLEEDLEYIQTGAKTHFFAIEQGGKRKCLFSEELIRKIDEEIQYIPEGVYMDDILWMLEKAISGNISEEERFEFILDNLNKYKDLSRVGFRERSLYVERTINYFFHDLRINAGKRSLASKVERHYCHRIVNGEKKYISCLITCFDEERIYLFNEDKMCYERISQEEFSKMAQNGLYVPNEGHAKKMKRYNSKVSSDAPAI